jgi:hypothetical protein
VSAWGRIQDGWALNVDGSSASKGFSLPRLEVRSSAKGWLSLCLFPDGTRCEHALPSSGSVADAQAATVEQARGMLTPEHAAALAHLLATPPG